MGYQGETTTEDTLVFAVNGERFQLSDVNPNTTLLEFLRTQTRFKSVKLGCGEGGCGACVVLLSKYNYALDQVEDITVSSCLTLLCSISGCSITTSEGLGNSKTGFHPIHQRFTGFHASQCGFCTPGICVSLFSALVNAGKTNRPEPPPGFSKLTASEAEKAVAGNLCRCTGYRPIADVCKSFAADVDIEDLGLNSFWGKEESKEEKISKLPLYKHTNEICTYPEFLRKEKEFRSCRWQSPASIEELQSLLHGVEANSPNSFKLVVGNTGSGYYKDVDDYDKYIDIRHIAELSWIRRDHTGIEIGTTVTISRAVEALRVATKDEFQPEGGMVFKKIADHMEKIGSGFLRNSASIGGNLVMAQRKNFPSDMTTVLLAVGAMVEIISGHKFEKLTLEEFLQRPPMDSRSVLLRLKIPRINTTSETNTLLMFETYRAAPRPLGNALPYLNAAFLAEISPSKSHDGVSVRNCRLALGAFGTKHSIRAKKVEEYLKGKVLNLAELYEATKLLSATVVPENGTSYPAYRSSLAAGFLFEFFGFLTETKPKIPRNGSCGDSNIMLSKVLKMKEDNNETKFPGLLSSSKQAFQLSGDYYPVGKPITKSGANLQASGEAIYVDDIPSPTNCLYGALLYSTKPLARVNSIEFKSKSLPNGFKALITFKDIPGKNIGLKTIFATEPLFADELTVSAGQLIGIVVADTQKNADRAANLTVVNYDVENLEPPILTVEEAVEKSSFFEVPSFIYPKQIGDISKGMEEADHKIISAKIKPGSQYYFYMETHAALAVPDEDNCMVVYSASQVPEYAHVTISKCLGIPEHNVRVITRRLGGGFGGKAMKSMPVATACALAAYKVQRPVKIYVNRKTDMITVGGRHPMKVTYTVGFKSSGKITALQLEILIDAGWSADVSPMIPKNILGTLRKYDFGALHFDIKVCKTNRPSRSAMRGPGEVQASFIGEAVIEHVASYLSMEADSVRQINFHSYDSLKFYFGGVVAGEQLEYTLPSIWEKLNLSSDFNQRTELVKEFNESNIWRKRGISRVPTIHEVVVRPTPGRVSILRDASVVVEVGGIELGQGLWTKVKQMAAFGLGLVKCGETKDLIDKVRVVQSDTLSMIQGGFTAGSTTSEQSCEAVRLCCLILVERLTPVSERLIQQMGSISWETLIHQAYLETVNLSASSYFVADLTSMEYLNYGAAVSEVEVNLLTGETTILRSDIIYDCGQSLNPAVDLGQIEGAFVQGIGYFMREEYPTNSEGLVLSHGTWSYKIPTMDTIPKQLRVEVLNSGHHQKRVLSSKASGEPPLLLAVSVHCATRAAIREARRQRLSWGCVDATDPTFQLGVPATMPVVKELTGLDSLEKYLSWRMKKK